MTRIRPYGDQGYLVSADSSDRAQTIAASLREAALFIDVVPGFDSVLCIFDPVHTQASAAKSLIERTLQTSVDDRPAPPPPITLPVRYGGAFGPDLKPLAAASGLSCDALIERHSQLAYKVALLGFTPGFTYLEGPPPQWRANRLREPRQRVDAGSVGLVDQYCGVYALGGPGGWPIIGQVATALFDPARSDPFLLSPGQTVRFAPA